MKLTMVHLSLDGDCYRHGLQGLILLQWQKYFLHRVIETGYKVHSASRLLLREEKADHSSPSTAQRRMRGAMSLLLHTSSWHT
jgi:hypothetical protein